MTLSTTSDTNSPDAPPRLRTIQALINPASGSVGPGAADIVAELVSRYGYALITTILEPHGMEAAVQAAIDAGPDLVLVLAGDGTARLAAERCGPDGPLIAPMPGGTLNMLPHALYGAQPWQDALLAILETGVERAVSGGRVGDHTFYVAAILGAPALWARAREAVRAGDLRQAIRRTAHALRRAFTGDVSYVLDGRMQRPVEALALITPLVSKAVDQDVGLEAAALGLRSASEAFRLAFNGLTGDWRRDPGVTTELCQAGRAKARHSIPAILDGEVLRLSRQVDFAFVPKAFRALAPETA